MSLVAYESSDDSEEDSGSNEKLNVEINKISDHAFQKKRETVKICIPSLSEFKDEESEESPKKKFIIQGGSGLFSILPPPKNSNILSKPGFTPYILSKKQDINKDSSVKTAPPTVKNSKRDFSPKTHGENENFKCEDHLESVNDEVTPNDFFSLNKEEVSSKVSTNTCLDEESNKISEPTISGSFALHDYHSSESDVQPHLQYDCLTYESKSEENITANTSVAPESNQEMPLEEPFLNEEVLKKLQGRRKEFEQINLIDVKADDQLSERNEWLMKSLTQEVEHRPKRRHGMPTQQQKRKHQITYLAFQAKERELDLKNQWALNSRTRRETQAKYGF